MATVAEQLDALAGTRHVSVVDALHGAALVTADLRAEAADRALATLEALGVSADDVALVRLDTIAPAAGAGDLTALIWADVLGQARVRARATARYLVLMAAAGVIAGLAVVNDSPTLIVGAMAISPDLFPVTAACTGIVFRRRRLVVRGLARAGRRARRDRRTRDGRRLHSSTRFDLLPQGFALDEFSAAQTHVNATTILVALTAGVAGMLAVETRASAAVGVAISVTTIPAAAYLGVALGIGELDAVALGAGGARREHRDDARRRLGRSRHPARHAPTRFLSTYSTRPLVRRYRSALWPRPPMQCLSA